MERTSPFPKKPQAPSERLDYLDAVRGICVILIVVEHHLLEAESAVKYLCSFSLTPFFLISGFLYGYQNEWEQPFRRILSRNLKRLIYPYCTFSILNLIWNVLYYKVVFPSAVPDFFTLRTMLLYTVTTYGYNALWYLPCMFWGTLLLAALRRLRHHRLIWGTATILLVVFYILFDQKLSGNGFASYLYSYLFRSCMAMVFLYGGQLLYEWNQCLDRKTERICLTFGILISGIILGLYLFYPEHFPIVNLSVHRLGNPYFYYLSALAPFTVLFLLCKKYSKPKGVLTYFGRNSLIVMALHMDVFVRIAWYVLAKLRIDFGETANSLIVIAMELAMSPVFVTVIRRYFPFLLRFPQKTQ